MRLRTYIIDAFVVGGQPGTGNAAGVVLLPSIMRDENRPIASTSTSNDGDGKEQAASPTLDDDARQRLAAELRQTETAFVERGKSDSRNNFLLRWFTPTTEVPLCGHATLAAAAALVAEGVGGCSEEEEEGEDEKQGEKKSNAGEVGKKTVVYSFETVSSGLLKVRVRFPPASASSSSSSSSAPTFELDLPSRPPTDPPPRGFRMQAAAEGPPSGSATTPATTALLRALGGNGGGGGNGDDDGSEPSLLRRLRGISFNAELGYLVVELEPGGGKERTSAAAAELIEGLSPDPRALREAASLAEEEDSSSGKKESGDKSGSSSSSPSSVSGVVVTSLYDDDGEDVMLSRFFGPWMGIDEDPATGSAHAVLAPLWDGELRRRRRRRRRERGGGAAGGDDEDDDGQLFWRARQLSARGGELSVCFQEGRGRVLVAGGAAVALEGWAHV